MHLILPSLLLCTLNWQSIVERAGGLVVPQANGTARVSFVNSTVSDDDFRRFAISLGKDDCANVSIVDLSGTRLTRQSLEHLRHLSRVEYLQFDEPSFAIGQDEIKMISRMPGLRQLRLGTCQFSDSAFAGCELQSLQTLELPETHITTCLLRSIQASCPEIIHLRFGECTFEEQCFSHFGQFRRLESLDLNGTDIQDSGLVQLGKCANLQQLGLEETNVTDHGIEGLTACGSLRELSIGESAVKGESLHKLERLSSLSLSGEKIQPVAIVSCLRLKELRSLSICDTPKISSHDVVAILGDSASLKELTVMGMDLDERAIRAIGQSSLRSLWLGWCTAPGAGLMGLGDNQSIEDLRLHGWDTLTTADLDEIHRMPKLRNLTIRSGHWIPNGLPKLRQIGLRLERLSLGFDNIKPNTQLALEIKRLVESVPRPNL